MHFADLIRSSGVKYLEETFFIKKNIHKHSILKKKLHMPKTILLSITIKIAIYWENKGEHNISTIYIYIYANTIYI